jgi:hypothetical protein
MNNSAGAFLLLVSFTLLYLLPSLVAVFRGVRRSNGLVLLNLLLGWTVLGWIGALIWAVQAETRAEALEARTGVRHPEHDAMHTLGRRLGSLVRNSDERIQSGR